MKTQDKIYIITGTDRNNKRFKIESNNLNYINCINIYNGSIWVKNGDNKRKLIKRIGRI